MLQHGSIIIMILPGSDEMAAMDQISKSIHSDNELSARYLMR